VFTNVVTPGAPVGTFTGCIMPVYIPQEILDRIIGYATADASDALHFSRRASFVSQTFHQIILPYKFRSLSFEFYGYRHPTVTPIPISKFCEAINAGDAHALSLAPLVQELSLLFWRGKDGFRNHLMPKPIEKILNGVLSFRNLTKLSMRKCLTTPAIMDQLGKLVQLQSLHTWRCHYYEEYEDKPEVSYGALSHLQSLHTLECEEDRRCVGQHLACIPMKNLRILKSSDDEVTEALLTTDPPVQLKELWLTSYWGGHSLLWSYLARATSLTHLSLQDLELPVPDGLTPSLIFPFQELQYLHVHVALAPRFADQPMKVMKINTETQSERGHLNLMVEVRQHWQGIVFPHVEYLEMDRWYDKMEEIPIEFWREFLLNVKKVG
jgi:hypothetical protein